MFDPATNAEFDLLQYLQVIWSSVLWEARIAVRWLVFPSQWNVVSAVVVSFLAVVWMILARILEAL